MDKKTRKKIKKTYQTEYLRAELADRTDRPGRMARWVMSGSKKANITLGLAASFEVAVIAGAGLAGGVVPMLVALGATNVVKAPLNVPLGITFARASRGANAAMERDIDSGLLAARYAAETAAKKKPKGPKI